MQVSDGNVIRLTWAEFDEMMAEYLARRGMVLQGDRYVSQVQVRWEQDITITLEGPKQDV